MEKHQQEIKSSFNSTSISLDLTQEYKSLLNDLKSRIRGARLKAALAINHEVIKLYWHIGKQIINKQNWGSKLIETLSLDLEIPSLKLVVSQ